jgi:GTPase Era involved in 16S rRNA processing
MPFGLLRSNLP